MKKDAYRHGDVVIIKADGIPKKSKKLNHLVLAEGEVTGHAHRVRGSEVELLEFEGNIFLSVKSDDAKVTHEEHKEIDLPVGDYEIRIQREYEPEGWRNVQD